MHAPKVTLLSMSAESVLCESRADGLARGDSHTRLGTPAVGGQLLITHVTSNTLYVPFHI